MIFEEIVSAVREHKPVFILGSNIEVFITGYITRNYPWEYNAIGDKL